MSRGEREMDARESASERDDAEMSDSDDEGLGGDDGLNGKDLYEILGLTKEATASEIKKAYPQGGASAAPRQEPLPRRRRVVSDVAEGVRRARGRGEAQGVRRDGASTTPNSPAKSSTLRVLRGIYRKVTEEDIDEFFRTYRGGEDEAKDIVDAYVKFEGDMSKVFMWVMCSEEAIDAA